MVRGWDGQLKSSESDGQKKNYVIVHKENINRRKMKKKICFIFSWKFHKGKNKIYKYYYLENINISGWDIRLSDLSSYIKITYIQSAIIMIAERGRKRKSIIRIEF